MTRPDKKIVEQYEKEVYVVFDPEEVIGGVPEFFTTFREANARLEEIVGECREAYAIEPDEPYVPEGAGIPADEARSIFLAQVYRRVLPNGEITMTS